jgi:hypothetical protein
MDHPAMTSGNSVDADYFSFSANSRSLWGFLNRFAFAKLTIILVRCSNAILDSLDFLMYVCERVCVRLIVHDVSPLTRILRLVQGHYGEFKGLVDDNTIIEGAAAARDRLKP